MKNVKLLLMLFLTGCSSGYFSLQPPTLDLIEREPLEMRPVEWSVVNDINCQQKIKEFENKGFGSSLICVHPDIGYSNLSNNMVDIQAFIELLIKENKILREFYENHKKEK